MPQLNTLPGKQWMYNGKNYNVLHVGEVEDKIIISTKEGILQINKQELNKELNNFLPVEAEKAIAIKGVNNLLVSQESSSIMKILNDTITKVSSDKSYVQQAAIINKNVNSMIQLAKVQVETLKAMRE